MKLFFGDRSLLIFREQMSTIYELYLCTSDCTKWGEFFSETLIIDPIIKIFHIKVYTLKKQASYFKEQLFRVNLRTSYNRVSPLDLKLNLVSGDPVLLHLFKLALQLRLSFHLLLSPANIDLFSIELFPIHFIYSLH